MSLLRGVVVTNNGTRHERVVLAIEGYPWHTNQQEAIACQNQSCKKCHHVYQLLGLEFDFELRRVYPIGQPDWPNIKYGGLGQIPPEDLYKFSADFGLYYSS